MLTRGVILAILEDESPADKLLVDKPPDPDESSAEFPVPDKDLDKSSAVAEFANDKPPAPATDKDVPMTVAEPDKPSPADKDVPMFVPVKPRGPKSSRSLTSAKVFCARVSKLVGPVRFPEFDVTGKEWDSKAKAYLRLQIKTAFSAKDIAVNNNNNLQMWQETDLRDVCTLFCELLSVRRDYLVDFVFGVIKSYWNSAKKSG